MDMSWLGLFNNGVRLEFRHPQNKGWTNLNFYKKEMAIQIIKSGIYLIRYKHIQ